MKKILFLIIFSIFFSVFNYEARASDIPEIDTVGCGSIGEGFSTVVQIDIWPKDLEDWRKAGNDFVIGKIVSNSGKTFTGYPKAFPTEPQLFNFSWTYLPKDSYECFVATIKDGIQGPWLLAGGARVGEIPECAPGYRYQGLYNLTDSQKIVDKKEKCRLVEWEYENFNDGFDKYISISAPYSPNLDNTSRGKVQIYCDKRKIQVYVWVPYADSFGWSGTAQVKFDSAGAKKVNYLVQKDFDGIVLKDSKTFMSQLTKSKATFGFKVPTVDGYETVSHYKGNLLEYRPIFAKAGCKF